jgi:hypothetical protein
MMQLILVVLAIALTASYLLISINYINPANLGTSSATNYGKLTIAGFEAMQNGYKKATTPLSTAFGMTPSTPLTDRAAPTVIGGLLLPVLPAAPPGYGWSYGGNSATYNNWVCLSPLGGNPTTQAIYSGLIKAGTRFSTSYSVTSGACGSTASSAPPVGFPAAYSATLWLQAW